MMGKKMKSIILISIVGLVLVIVLGLRFAKAYSVKKLEERVKLADTCLTDKDYERALILYNNILSRNPDKNVDGVLYYKSGTALMGLSRFDKAAEYWNAVLTEFPDSSYVDYAYLSLGIVEEKQNSLDEAAAYFTKVVQNFNREDIVDDALLMLGGIYEKKGRLVEAKDTYKKIVNGFKDADSYSLALNKLGDVNMRLIFSSVYTDDCLIYQVQLGDTLIGIAMKYNTTVSLIMEANGLKNTIIRPGLKLKITPNKFSIVVNATDNYLKLLKDNQIVKVYRIASGVGGNTPRGEMKIVNKIADPTWYSANAVVPSGSPENILGTRWMGFDVSGYGIHGTVDPGSIGEHSTLGCIRMLNEEVEELYKVVTIGTEVKITDDEDDL